MLPFFPEIFDEFLSPDFLKEVRQKFHYDEAQALEFQEVAEKMLPRMREEAFWERRVSPGENKHRGRTDGVVCEHVVMSLGNGVDRLQESYNEREMLSQSYMLEVLAGEVLLRGYAAYNRYVKNNTDWHVAAYHFPGSEEDFPLEMLPEMLKELTPAVTCNSAFCMRPQKSVAFVAELTKDDNVLCRGICAGCSNTDCSNRMVEIIG
ncbi:MAG: hypothetical protein NC180_10305 [Muribaculaceae bacterium]|nr:hypothetical protein [Roseburia sp.]MCM1431972.1 hypothetical protein [Muribaculaceae bacterium]MCM1493602.1 hypothetical protein [Muribaculaceae bacterium]